MKEYEGNAGHFFLGGGGGGWVGYVLGITVFGLGFKVEVLAFGNYSNDNSCYHVLWKPANHS